MLNPPARYPLLTVAYMLLPLSDNVAVSPIFGNSWLYELWLLPLSFDDRVFSAAAPITLADTVIAARVSYSTATRL